jgi:hypothetical protein
VFAFLEGAFGDLVELGAVVVQGADMTPVDLVGAGLEMIGAEGREAFQQRVDLELGGEEGVEGFGVVGRAAPKLQDTCSDSKIRRLCHQPAHRLETANLSSAIDPPGLGAYATKMPGTRTGETREPKNA